MTKKKTLTKKQSVDLYAEAMKSLTSQARLAELMGVTQATVSQYKQGKTILQGPALRVIMMIIEIPGWMIDNLIKMNQKLSDKYKIKPQ